MNETTSKEDRRKQILKALGGVAAFLGFGLVLMPGFARKEAVPENAPAVARTADEPRTVTGIDLDDLGQAPSQSMAASTAAGQGGAFDCMIVPTEMVDVGSAVSGVVAEVAAERGDYVEEGQVLAKLEASVEEAALRVAQARAERTDGITASQTQLALSRRRLDRAEELFSRDVLSLDTREEVRANAELAELELEREREDHRLAGLQLEQARANLERRTIRAPVSGVVIDRLRGVGEVVDDDTIVQIARIDPLRVEAILPADWFGRMRPGDRAEITPEAPLDAKREARVAIVDPVLDGASGTFGVQLDLPNPDRGLPAGLRCQVHFDAETNQGEGAATPETASRPLRPASAPSLVWVPAAASLPAVSSAGPPEAAAETSP